MRIYRLLILPNICWYTEVFVGWKTGWKLLQLFHPSHKNQGLLNAPIHLDISGAMHDIPNPDRVYIIL